LIDEQKQIVPIDPARALTPKNMAYVHAYCCAGLAEFYDDEVDTRFDLYALLLRLKARREPVLNKDSIFV
jgi:hypothetical protein